VLLYAAIVEPVEGIDIAWDALRCDEETLRSTAAIAISHYVRHGLAPTAVQIEALVEAVRSSTGATTKSLVLSVLHDIGYAGYEGLLVNLQGDESADVRFEANWRLLRLGHDIKAALLEDLEGLGWRTQHGVELLWAQRERLRLTGEEEDMLRTRILDSLAKRREVCRNSSRPENSALFLFEWLKKGFPSEPDDVDLVGESVSHAHFTWERLEAVRAVAWFNNDRARDWLRRLSEEPYQPAVRREAQRQLRKLTAR
jgi:hypothetical protein